MINLERKVISLLLLSQESRGRRPRFSRLIGTAPILVMLLVPIF